MINIKKTHGPASLQTYAANGYRYDEHTSFSAVKQEIRECLCDEQGYICCYCMRRIEPNGDSMQIAHMKNQEEHQDLDCQYSNMLGSCSCMETCNQKQKQHDLKFYPTDINHSMQMLIHFDSNGTISATDTEFNDELNKWLNLNSAKMFFKQNRAAILAAVNAELKKVSSFEERKRKAQKLLSFWESRDDGRLREYCGVAIWLLRKKLSQWGVA